MLRITLMKMAILGRTASCGFRVGFLPRGIRCYVSPTLDARTFLAESPCGF